MRFYSDRSSPSSAKGPASKGLLVAVIVLLILVPALFVAGIYYLSQPFTGTNVSGPTFSPSPSAPTLSPSPAQPGVSPPTLTPSPSPPTTSYPTYTLAEAISAGYVQANITGVSGASIGSAGASSGDVIILHIKRLVNYPIEITVLPTGTLLVPNSASAQTMAILKLEGIEVGSGYHRARSQIILDTSEPVEYLFSAYCVDFTKNNPNATTTFTQSGMANPDVIKIFNILDQLPSNTTSITAIQTAVFVVTNNVSASELSSRFTSSTTEIQNAKTILQEAGISTTNKRLFQ